MSRTTLKVILPILCSIALLFSVVGTVLVSGSGVTVQTWRDEPNEVEKILQRDGYLEGIWYPWFRHAWLGHCLTGNDMVADVLDSDNWMKVGIDQYGEINIYREIYNLKALGFNILGYEGSPYGEGVIYDDNGDVLGIKEEYLNNVRRLLDICKEIGMPVLWSITFHTSSFNEVIDDPDNKLVWDRVAQAYGNPEVADHYAERFVKPLCAVLAEYPETVVMVSSGVELENEINDSDIGDHFEQRLLYGVNRDDMLYFLKAVTDTVRQELPNVSITNSSNASDMTWYEDIDFDFLGRNQYTQSAVPRDIEDMRATAPVIATEFGLGDGVVVDDEIWTIKQIQFRDNFMVEGYSGWMYWCWSNQGYGGVYDLLAADGKSTTDFRAGAYTIHYYAESYRAAHRGEETILDKTVLFCNKGSGTVEWISSRQATSLDLLRSLDGGKTWKTLEKGMDPYEYEVNFKGTYIDEEVANMQPDGTTVMYKMIAYDDYGNVAESDPTNEAVVTGPPINLLADYNCDFEDGMDGWQEFGENGANYTAQVIEVEDAPSGTKVLEFKKNSGGSDWSGIHLDGIDVKPNTQYKIVLKYKIASDAEFAYDESDEVNKMSGYLFLRYLGADGEGTGLGDLYDDSETALYMLRGSKNEWREDSAIFKTNESGKLGLDFRAVSYLGVPVHYYIDSIELYEVV